MPGEARHQLAVVTAPAGGVHVQQRHPRAAPVAEEGRERVGVGILAGGSKAGHRTTVLDVEDGQNLQGEPFPTRPGLMVPQGPDGCYPCSSAARRARAASAWAWRRAWLEPVASRPPQATRTV